MMLCKGGDADQMRQALRILWFDHAAQKCIKLDLRHACILLHMALSSCVVSFSS